MVICQDSEDGTARLVEPGTSWQLVKFQGSDGTTLTPDDGTKYTIELAAGGQLTARVDCNRGRGTWKSAGSNQLQFGPLALTRAKCPAGSMHDHIVKQWSYVRSYVVKDGHLCLALMADGGIHEFEPMPRSRSRRGGSGAASTSMLRTRSKMVSPSGQMERRA